MGKLADKRNHRFAQKNLSAYLDGELSERDAARVRAHLARCEICRRELADLQATIRALAGMPRLALPRSFALPPQAAARQQRLRRLDTGFAVLRTAGIAVTIALVLLVSGDVLLARGIVAPPAPRMAQQLEAAPLVAMEAEADAPQFRAPIAPAQEPEAPLALEAAGALEAAAGVEAAEEAETEAEGEPIALLQAAPAEQPMPTPEPPLAMAAELAATPLPTETASQVAPTETPAPTAPTPGAPTPPATPIGRPAERPPELAAPTPTGAADEQPTPSLAPETPTPELPAMATPTPTETPLPTATATPVTPTAQPAPLVEAQAATPTTPAEETMAMAVAPAEEESAVEAAPPEEEITLKRVAPEEPLAEPVTPEEEVAVLALEVPSVSLEASPEPLPAERLAATVPPEATATVRATLRRAIAILAGIALMVFGGLLWLGHRRRL